MGIFNPYSNGAKGLPALRFGIFSWMIAGFFCGMVFATPQKVYVPDQDPEIQEIKKSMSIEEAVRTLNSGLTFFFLSIDNRVLGSNIDDKNKDLNFIFTKDGLSYPDFSYFYTTEQKHIISHGPPVEKYEIRTFKHYAPCSVSFRFAEIKGIIVRKDMNLEFRNIYDINLVSDRWPANPKKNTFFFCIRALKNDGKRVLAALEKLCPNLELSRENGQGEMDQTDGSELQSAGSFKIGLFDLNVDGTKDDDYGSSLLGEIIDAVNRVFRDNDSISYVPREKLIFSWQQDGRSLPIDDFFRQNDLENVLIINIIRTLSVGYGKKLHMITNWKVVDKNGKKRSIKTSVKSKHSVGVFPKVNNPEYSQIWVGLAEESAREFLKKY